MAFLISHIVYKYTYSHHIYVESASLVQRCRRKVTKGRAYGRSVPLTLTPSSDMLLKMGFPPVSALSWPAFMLSMSPRSIAATVMPTHNYMYTLRAQLRLVFAPGLDTWDPTPLLTAVGRVQDCSERFPAIRISPHFLDAMNVFLKREGHSNPSRASGSELLAQSHYTIATADS